ncbi:MAG: HAD-IA family hydrolase [Pseudomonadota bacterium]
MSRLDNWTIVFDLDGTLVETAPDLLRALNHTLEHAGIPAVALPDIREMIGHGAKAMIARGFELHGSALPPDDLEAHWDRFLAHYRVNIAVDSHPYEGVVESLEALKSSGATLAVCTNKTQALAEELLGRLSMSTHFAAIVGADAVPQKKPHGDHIVQAVLRAGGHPSRAIMIGDSQTDETAAHNAGLPFLFVPFGYEATPAEQINAAAVVSHYSKLHDLVVAAAL